MPSFCEKYAPITLNMIIGNRNQMYWRSAFVVLRYLITLGNRYGFIVLLKWVDQNIPVRYLSKKDVANAYSVLALASRFNNNATRTNYYGYLRYSNDLMSGTVPPAQTKVRPNPKKRRTQNHNQ